jgi:hypothetical protein
MTDLMKWSDKLEKIFQDRAEERYKWDSAGMNRFAADAHADSRAIARVQDVLDEMRACMDVIDAHTTQAELNDIVARADKVQEYAS